MHGYFVSLKLYEAARLIANPFAYAEHHEKMVRDKMDKLAETRIRSKKAAPGVKVNKGLAEKIIREEEKAAKKKLKTSERKKGTEMDVDVAGEKEPAGPMSTLLSDPRFAQVFEDPAFAIDDKSREYALLNPSGVSQRNRGKTAVEDEEDESDKVSSDGLGGSSDEDASEDEGGSDSSDAGGELFCLLLHVTYVLLTLSRRTYQVRSTLPTWPAQSARQGSVRQTEATESAGERQNGTDACTNWFWRWCRQECYIRSTA